MTAVRSTRPTQCERVLRLLRERRERGLNTVEMVQIPTADGGKPVLRLAARIHNLRQQGYRIRSERKLNSTETYILVGEPERAPHTSASGPRRSASTEQERPSETADQL